MNPKQILALVLVPNLAIAAVVCYLQIWKPDPISPGSQSLQSVVSEKVASAKTRSYDSAQTPPVTSANATSSPGVQTGEAVVNAPAKEQVQAQGSLEKTVAKTVLPPPAQPQALVYPKRINIRQPAVLMDPPASLGLSQKQLDLIDTLRDNFLKSTDATNPNQNPYDPTYAQRWMSAQQQSDEILKSRIGWVAFNQYQIEAARQQPAGRK